MGESRGVQALVTRTPLGKAASRRFVAGESMDDFFVVARALVTQGLAVTANHLGEGVRSPEMAREATQAYLDLIDRAREEKFDGQVSIKLTQLGLEVGSEVLTVNAEALLDRAAATGRFIRFDMEASRHVRATLDLLTKMWSRGRRNIGVVLQAYLLRTPGDLRTMIDRGVSVRLCKGAYAEPAERAYQTTEQVRYAFRKLAHELLREGVEPAIATHDEVLLNDVTEFASREGISSQRFEFEMLYGVRRDLQRALLDHGYRVRVYVPFGRHWYPYLLRRLTERPGNALFVAANVLKESPLGAFWRGSRSLNNREQ